MKKNILPIVAIAATIIIGGIYIGHLRSQVKYAGFPCPVCGSSEVLDFGTNDQGDQRAQCFDCKTDFTISEVTVYDDAICR
ncbi:MAG: hypothetical protein IJS97_09445 [Prevotella sp.]|nr:hypothetical protein [Prevotella sp.]